MCLGLVIVGPLLALLVGMVLRVWGAGRVDSTWPWVAKARQGQDARWSSWPSLVLRGHLWLLSPQNITKTLPCFLSFDKVAKHGVKQLEFL